MRYQQIGHFDKVLKIATEIGKYRELWRKLKHGLQKLWDESQKIEKKNIFVAYSGTGVQEHLQLQYDWAEN